jgi:hypothetical protein
LAGLPIGAIADRASVMQMFDPEEKKPAVPQGGTFSVSDVDDRRSRRHVVLGPCRFRSSRAPRRHAPRAISPGDRPMAGRILRHRRRIPIPNSSQTPTAARYSRSLLDSQRGSRHEGADPVLCCRRHHSSKWGGRVPLHTDGRCRNQLDRTSVRAVSVEPGPVHGMGSVMTHDNSVTVAERIALALKRHGGEVLFAQGLPSARHPCSGSTWDQTNRLLSGKYGRRHGNVSARRCRHRFRLARLLHLCCLHRDCKSRHLLDGAQAGPRVA